MWTKITIYGMEEQMRVECQNGYYKFFPDFIGELKLFTAQQKLHLVAEGDYYTFPALKNMPDYSFIGWKIGNSIGKVNFAGSKWDVMEKNDLAFNPKLGVVDRIINAGTQEVINGAEITYTLSLPLVGRFIGLKQIRGFSGFWFMDFNRYQIERFDYAGI